MDFLRGEYSTPLKFKTQSEKQNLNWNPMAGHAFFHPHINICEEETAEMCT